ACSGPDQLLNGVSLHSRIAQAEEAGWNEVPKTHREDDAVAHMEAALKFLGKASGNPVVPPSDAPSALAIVLSMVGVVPNVLGNMQGPRSLSLAIVEITTLYNLPLAIKSTTIANQLYAKARGLLSVCLGLNAVELHELDLAIIDDIVFKGQNQKVKNLS